METERAVIPGLVKDGLIVPQGPISLPEGAQVEIVIPSTSPELMLELRVDLNA